MAESDPALKAAPAAGGCTAVVKTLSAVIVVAVLVAAVTVAATCGTGYCKTTPPPPAAPPTVSSVSGQALDAFTGAPIAHVRVSSSIANTTTNANGTFIIPIALGGTSASFVVNGCTGVSAALCNSSYAPNVSVLSDGAPTVPRSGVGLGGAPQTDTLRCC